MRSRILQAKDYRTVDVKPWFAPFVPDEEALEKELRRLANPHIRWEAGEKAAAGDQVVCRLESACPRFQRDKVRFVAGSGMFHGDLEALSIGMRAGETRRISLPEGEVALTLTEVTRRIVPEVTDEMVREQGLENIRTVAAYRGHLIRQQKEEAFREASYGLQQALMEEVIRDSEFILCKEDWTAFVERKLQHSRTLCRQEGMVLEEMTPEQFQGRIPVKSFHELVAMVQKLSWDDLCIYLLGCRYAESDGFQVSGADYEIFLADYVKTWHTTEEKAREANPYEGFVFNEVRWHAYSVHGQYLREQYFAED